MSDKYRITLTDSLVNKVKQLREAEGDPGLMLRVSVHGGGCQGFEYGFEFDSKTEDGDQIFEKDGIKVVIDEASLGLLDGAEIDFVTEMIGASFKINNPNAKSSCGCGTSFSV